MVILQEDMNEIISALQFSADLLDRKTITITKKTVEDMSEFTEGMDDALEELIGWKVKVVEVDGEHKHDGQLVEYSIQFTNPKGKKTIINTEMCLMVGWNFCEKKYNI